MNDTGGATHYCYFDIEIDGKDSGRLDFELYGKKSPKSINSFLAFLSGDFDPLMRYKGCSFHRIHEQRFLQSGDFINRDGTGSATVYPEDNNEKFYKATMPAEENGLEFVEPYILAMAANNAGQTGSQFFITTDKLTPLNGSKHTIIGRLIRGKSTIDLMEGTESFRHFTRGLTNDLPNSGGLPFNEQEKEEVSIVNVVISDCGVYKFETSDNVRKTFSGAGRTDFNPEDFLRSRQQK